MQAKAQLEAPKPKFYRVKVCGRQGSPPVTTRPHRRCSYECMQSAVNDINISDELSHKFALSEILFWTVKYEFPEKITTWLLGLLPDDTFKVFFYYSVAEIHDGKIQIKAFYFLIQNKTK